MMSLAFERYYVKKWVSCNMLTSREVDCHLYYIHLILRKQKQVLILHNWKYSTLFLLSREKLAQIKVGFIFFCVAVFYDMPSP